MAWLLAHVFPFAVIMVGVVLRLYGHEEVGRDLMFGGFALAQPMQLADTFGKKKAEGDGDKG